jgi:hypothetical protein
MVRNTPCSPRKRTDFHWLYEGFEGFHERDHVPDSVHSMRMASQ